MKNRILICNGTSGISAGAEKVADFFKEGLERYNLQDDYDVIKTGDRGLFRDVLVDIVVPDAERITYEYVTPDDVSKIVEEHLVKGEPVEKMLAGEDYKQFFAGQTRIVLANCGEIDPESLDDYLAHNGYKALKNVLSMTPDDAIKEMKTAGLRGRGGAGFPTGMKWDFCRQAEGDQKYIVCNADEGDPGAFMDRSYIYCRAEYPIAIKRLTRAISQSEERGYLGKNIQGSGHSFHLTIKQGAGAFVCGEETALLASIEGRRGMPKPRPPFPAQKGLWGKPTTINNVETLANIRHIFEKGAQWFASVGTENSKGTKVFALAGKVKNTGLVEVPMGMTIRDLVFGPGGGMLRKKAKFKGIQLGGPSGGCLPEDLLDTPIDYESINQTGAIMGSGGMVVMDTRTCMVDVARFFLDFTVTESCGKCVPCRIGLKRTLEVLDEITAGRGTEEHLTFLKEMGNTIKNTALCGLGNTAPNPVLTTLRYFPEEYQAHIHDHMCPAHVCTALVKFEFIEENCTKCGQCFKACPVGAISWEKKQYPILDKEKCIKCKSCIDACNFEAIQ